MLNYSRSVALAIAFLVTLPAGSAFAQEFELNRWRPASSLRYDYITLDGGRADMARGFELGLWLHYADDPLVATMDDEPFEKIVTGQLTAHVVAAFEFADRVRLGVDIPAYLLQSTDRDDLVGRDLSGGGIGDIRVTPKLELFDGRADGSGGAALALVVPVWLPTGDGSRLQGEGFRGRPTLAFDWRNARELGFAVNAGVTIRESVTARNLDVNEEFHWGLGVNVPLGDGPLEIVGELDSALPLTDGVTTEEMPMDLMAMLRVGLDDVVFGVGSGLGLNEGWGTPDFRVFGMIGYSPGEKEEEPTPVVEAVQQRLDTDGDGYFDDEDGCPEEPEDFDEIEDADGCPEDDVDGDGILDADDECVFEPEDVDGWVDADGCPDPDNDSDNVPDESDDCRGIDGDVLADVQEFWNEFEDDDGCPDALAELTETHIQINGIIYFDLDSDVIQQRSMAVVNDVARILGEHPDITLVEVAGFTDTRAPDAYNLDLSARRARSVRAALVSAGINESRLTSQGYGETELADLGTTDQAHQRNRRVEFRIMEREQPAAEEK